MHLASKAGHTSVIKLIFARIIESDAIEMILKKNDSEAPSLNPNPSAKKVSQSGEFQKQR